MSKKDEENRQNLRELIEKEKIQPIEVVGELKKSFIAYAMAVNVSRAIPDVRDGLKPVHRRILFSMGELNNFYNNPHKKSARIVGEVMGKYHPHGDSSVYDALVRLAQDFSIRYPLVDGHGNFGSVDGDPPAAQRYTEARLSKIAALMLEDIDKETVDFYPNFDDTLMQPSVLPAKFPNLLVNGADGIAVGMATNIPPHNLTEVINGVQALIDNPDIDIEDLIKIIPAPDYPTGGIIMGRTAVKHAYKTGRGGILVRGRAEIEETSTGRQRIVITELPYQVNKARFVTQIADLVKNKKLEGISDLRDESDRAGLRVVVEVKKDANAQVVLNSLYKHTMLQQSSGIIMLALVKGEPKVLNLKEMLYHYLEHQKEVCVRKTRFDLKKAEEREHIVKGLVIALASIDEVIKTIKQSKDKQEAVLNLTTNFELDEIQANAILEMKLSKLTSLEVEKLNAELAELEALITDLKDILDRPERVLQIVRDDLEAVKNAYGDERKTEISMDMGGIDIEDLIAEEDVIVSLTHMGYIKRMSTDEYKAQHRGGVGITAHKTKDEDFVERMLVTSTHDTLLFFTNLGKVYSSKAYEIPEAQRQAKGRAIINLLQLSLGEKVNAIIPMEADSKGNLIMATKMGLIKKTPLSEYENIRKVGKIAIKLLEGDELIGVNITSGRDDILIASHEGKCIRFNETDVRAVGRDSQGVRSMKLASEDYIVDMAIVHEGSQILTISNQGYGKLTHVDEFRIQQRGGSGVKAGIFNEKTGKLASLKQIEETCDLLVITDNGVIIRTPVDDISQFSRVSQGVRIMKLKNDSKITSVALTEKEEIAEETAEEGETSESTAVENAAETEIVATTAENLSENETSDTEANDEE
ncbi:MAG: DNA gyrase subunit A [Clostridia bacterium]|nr:DNA gyrase subunit A [Clostridia bacterium]